MSSRIHLHVHIHGRLLPIILMLLAGSACGREQPKLGVTERGLEFGPTDAVNLPITAGPAHTCAIVNGGIQCWGENYAGQLGNGSTTSSAVPVSVNGLTTGAQAIAAGAGHTCAIVNGGVQCWGANAQGQLGNNSTTSSAAPVPVNGLTTGVEAIAAGWYHTCAIVSGAAWCWGYNGNGLGILGDGSAVDKSPVPVPAFGLTSGVQAIAANYDHTCAVVNGAVQCWGSNFWGQLGDGSTTGSAVPVPVTGLQGGTAQAVTAGYQHSCAVIDGLPWCWGRNSSGELGNGSNTDSRSPVPVASITGGVQAIAAGAHYTCAVVNGGAQCWGNDYSGQLGNGAMYSSNVPSQVSGLTGGVQAIAAGRSYACAIANGVWCWGENTSGQLGNHTSVGSLVPVQVDAAVQVGAISLVGAGSASGSGQPSLPVGWVDSDILVVVAQGNTVTPADWTLQVGGNTYGQLKVLWKRAGPNEITPNFGPDCWCQMAAYRGASPTGCPFEATGATASTHYSLPGGSWQQGPQAPSINTLTNGAWVLGAAAGVADDHYHDSNCNTGSGALQPSPLTGVAISQSSWSGPSFLNPARAVGLHHGKKILAGATGPARSIIESYVEGYGYANMDTVLLALKPEPAPIGCGAAPPPSGCVQWECNQGTHEWQPVPAPLYTRCRESTGECDVAEYCDGMSTTCPADLFSDKLCRPTAGECDAAEYCDGMNPTCPADQFSDSLCRPSAGECDVAEYCDGSSAACPADTFAPSYTVCRAGAGACDASETCTGVEVTCPADALKPEGASCSDGDFCNGEESCNSTGACLSGTPVATDDSDWCTADSCDPVLGISHDPIIGCTPPPTNDPTVTTDVATGTAFLYSGANPVQTGVAEGTIEAGRVAVVRGVVKDRDGIAMDGVTVTILGHPEFGSTLTRTDGIFDMAVNGGGLLTVDYKKDGYVPAQRQVRAPWRDYAWADELVLVPFDAAVTSVALGASLMQAARGSAVTDDDGTRQATLLFPAGTQAWMVLTDGTTQALSTMNVRATEYTVGPDGPKAMPAALPPTSAYTYAVELSVDEAVAAGATSVEFDRPVAFYVENFLEFPVGGIVPVGYYDRTKGVWVPSDNGRVVKIVSVTGGLAELDINGDGQADDAAALAALGVADEERSRLAATYLPGASLWRAPITHFSPWDCNWPYGCEGGPASCPPPNPPPLPPPLPDDPCEQSGSIIECQTQVLGERFPITGTNLALHYTSRRTPGYAVERALKIPLLPATYASTIERVGLTVAIAGQRHAFTFPASPNLTYNFLWDGKDGYGRSVFGSAEAKIGISYYYRAVYLEPATLAASFSAFSASGIAASSVGRTYVVVPIQYTATLRAAAPSPVAGWSLNVHHQYDVTGRRLLLGDGSERSVQANNGVVTTVAGTGAPPQLGAPAGALNRPGGVAVGSDGALFIADTYDHKIMRVAPDGSINAYTGGYYAPGVAVGPDGALFIPDGYHRVRRVGPDGTDTTVAGMAWQSGYSGDGGLATAAKLQLPHGVAAGADGALFIADYGNSRIRRVGPDGIITTVAGTDGLPGYNGDDRPATAATLKRPRGVAVGANGELFIADSENNRIRRVGPDGIITTVAGTGTSGFSGDGGRATEATLNDPYGVAVATDGGLFIADRGNSRIRRLGADGIITTVAGGGGTGDGGPATAARFVYPEGVAAGPHGALFIADTLNYRVRVVRPVLPGWSAGDFSVVSEDGREVFVFHSSGRHLRTLDVTTGAIRYIFGYDADGHLASVTDGDGNVTRIQPTTEGTQLTVIAPAGQLTLLHIGSNGMVSSIARPGGETTGLTYYPGGLLEYVTDPRLYVHHFYYDELGRLTKDENPAGGHKLLVRSEADAEFTVTVSTALGRESTYRVQGLSTGGTSRVNTAPDDTQIIQQRSTNGSASSSMPDGTTITTQLGPDPRFGMQAPVSSATVQTPAGRTLSVAENRTATLSIATDPLSATALGETVTVNGRAHVSTYDAATRTWTSTTPVGRIIRSILDDKGKLARLEPPGMLPISFQYYPVTGRPWTITQGTRTYTMDYHTEGDGSGFLKKITDPASQSTSFTYYPTGRVWTETLPGSRTVTFGYDASGNMTSLTPPERPAHGFDYTPTQSSYTPPIVPDTGSTTQSYDLDGALAQVLLPDTGTIVPTYFPAQPRQIGRSGNLESLTTWRGTTSLDYDTAGRLWTVVAPDGGTLTLAYDGSLVTSETWSGVVAGSVSHGYDNDFRIESTSVNGANAIINGYDADGLMTSAGALSMPREPTTGRMSGTTLGVVTTTPGYDPDFGELETMTAKAGGTTLYSYTLTRDPELGGGAGRITGKTETIDGITTTYEYVPDAAGRLHQVKVNGVLAETYDYDSNGNRLLKTTAGGGVEVGIPDDQDRLGTYGPSGAITSYTYGAGGDLQSKNVAGATTWYGYDPFGNLVSAEMPDGTQLEYVIDGLNRRIGKKRGGQLVEGFLYEGQLRPVAWLNGAGQVYARFVYGTRVNVPEYIVTPSGTFRLLTDHLGSPRLVVNTSTGAIAQRMDYDAWGNVLLDTSPGFQPFGFAGGLYDRDTGLVRFGARDYDPQTGRWTNKDPIRFAGGTTNLYEYVGNDPINFVDPWGLKCRRYWERVWDNFVLTNKAIPGLFVPPLSTGVLFWAAGVPADAFVSGGISPLAWAASGFRGATLAGTTFTAAETGVIAGATAIANWGLMSLAFEAGVGIGSLIEAAFEGSDCNNGCGG